MNIYTLIKADHRKVKVLLKQLTRATQESSKASASRNEALLKKIRRELEAHNHAEEEVFYDRLRKSRKSRVLAFEGKNEHDLGERVLKDLAHLHGQSEEFAAMSKILRELVEHHIEEEEGEVHKQAKKELSDEEAKEIGREFVALKKKLLGKSGRGSFFKKLGEVQGPEENRMFQAA